MCGKETAAHTECVFEADHDPPCMDRRGKRHFVLHGELPGAEGFTAPKVPPGARFMVRLGADRSVPIFTLEEVANEKRDTFERDRLLATTMAAWASVMRQAPPTSGQRTLAETNGKLLDEVRKLGAEVERQATAYGQLEALARAAIMSRRSIGKDEQGRRLITWHEMTRELIALGNLVWPSPQLDAMGLSEEDKAALRALVPPPYDFGPGDRDVVRFACGFCRKEFGPFDSKEEGERFAEEHSQTHVQAVPS